MNKTLKNIIVGLLVTIAVLAAGYMVYNYVYRSIRALKELSEQRADVMSEYQKQPEGEAGDERADGGQKTDATGAKTKEELRATFEDHLDKILANINYYYYEDADIEKIYDDMLHTAVYSLGDPYSTYYSPEEMEELIQNSSGVYSGIGATITQSYETMEMTIVTPFAGSPADESGILPGDQIIAVNGENVIGRDLDDVVAIIKGPEGTIVKITMLRDGEQIEFTVTRRSINVEYVQHRMLDDQVGYILVSEFETLTADQFNDAIKDLQKQGMKGLVIDLRGNPGGMYDIVCQMLDRILPKGSLLVYTVDKRDRKVETFAETKTTLDIPIAVLMNGYSASASEIFAGALQDYGAATIVGTQSYGKGIVQSVFYLSDDYSGIKLTSSRYFTPKGVCIHGVGITPDVEVELEEGLEKMLIERRDHDNQIDAAVDVIHEKLKK